MTKKKSEAAASLPGKELPVIAKDLPSATKDLPIATNADQIFERNDRPEKTISVPEWGCSIVARPLDARTVSVISASTTNAKGETDSLEFAARYMFESVIQPKMEPRHIEMIKERNNIVFLRVYGEIAGKKKEPSGS